MWFRAAHGQASPSEEWQGVRVTTPDEVGFESVDPILARVFATWDAAGHFVQAWDDQWRLVGESAEVRASKVESVIGEAIVRDLIPKLIAAGAVGIIEYPLNKVV